MGLVIYGGSFNPPHIAHMRLAIETLEALAPRVDRLEFVPCATPAHKKVAGLLPFDLRVAMIEASIWNMPRMSCNALEAARQGPSYTWDTLREYRKTHKAEELYFLVGSQDFAMLDMWHKGLELPELCHLVVAKRGEFSTADFEKQVKAFWPGASALQNGPGDLAHIDVPCGTSIIYAPLPYLDISASAIRKLWLAGKNVEYLMPMPALRLLNEQKEEVLAHWLEDN